MLRKLQKLKKLLDIDDSNMALSGIISQRSDIGDLEEINFRTNDDFEFRLKEEKKPLEKLHRFEVNTSRNNSGDSSEPPNAFLPSIPFAMAIIGVVKAGKSTFMRSILDVYIEAFDKVIMISPTLDLDPEAIDILDQYPDIHAFKSLGALEPLFKKIKKANKGKDPSEKVKTLIIMDDVINEIIKFSRKDNNFLNNMMLNRRHAGISMLMMSQYFKRFPPIFRCNFTAFALFRQENSAERKKIIEELGGFLGNKEFERLFNMATLEPYSAMTINFDTSDKKYQYTQNFNTVIHNGNSSQLESTF